MIVIGIPAKPCGFLRRDRLAFDFISLFRLPDVKRTSYRTLHVTRWHLFTKWVPLRERLINAGLPRSIAAAVSIEEAAMGWRSACGSVRIINAVKRLFVAIPFDMNKRRLRKKLPAFYGWIAVSKVHFPGAIAAHPAFPGKIGWEMGIGYRANQNGSRNVQHLLDQLIVIQQTIVKSVVITA